MFNITPLTKVVINPKEKTAFIRCDSLVETVDNDNQFNRWVKTYRRHLKSNYSVPLNCLMLSMLSDKKEYLPEALTNTGFHRGSEVGRLKILSMSVTKVGEHQFKITTLLKIYSDESWLVQELTNLSGNILNRALFSTGIWHEGSYSLMDYIFSLPEKVPSEMVPSYGYELIDGRPVRKELEFNKTPFAMVTVIPSMIGKGHTYCLEQ